MTSSDRGGWPAHAGRRVGRFTIRERLAVGGMAEVFVATADEGGEVVLKVLLPQLADDRELVQMFDDEARLTLALDHPRLVRTLARGEAEGRRYLALELVDGADLARLLRHHGALGVPSALAVADAVLEGLAYLHGRRDEQGRPLGVVHRDVSPKNVLLSRAGAVKLGDFGIARSRLRAARTRTGVIKGTVQYMAPEQIAGDAVDARADVYGAGLVLYEMLCGQPLIAAEREVDLLRVAEEPPWRPPSSVAPALPRALDRLLEPALARFPEQRYGTAEGMRDALQRCAAQLGVALAGPAALAELVRAAVAGDGRRGARAAHGAGSAARAGTALHQRATAARARPRWLPLAVALLVGGAVGLASWQLLAPRERELPAGGAQPPPDAATADAASADGGAPAVARAADAAGERASTERGAPADLRPAPRSAKRRPRRRRPQAPRSAKRRDAGAAQPPAPAATLDALRRRLAALAATMRRRALLDDDLAPAARRQLARARAAIRRRQADAPTTAALRAAEAAVAAIRVDRAFVRAKLKRVDGQLRRLPAKSRRRARLEQQAAIALQSLLDGRHRQANRQLTRIAHGL